MSKSKNKKLTAEESKLISAFRKVLQESLLSEDTTLSDMLSKVEHDLDETSHTSQFRWEGIDDTFKLKVAGSPHEDALTSAFFQTHSYKYLDNPTFKLSFERELKQRAVPTKEIVEAMKVVDEMVADLEKNPGEQDSGWHPNMDEIVDVTSNADDRDAKPSEPFSGGGLYPEGDEFDRGSLEGF